MSVMASQVTGVSIVCSVGSDADQKRHQISTSLAFVSGIQRWPMNSPHKMPVTPKMFPFDNVIMNSSALVMLKRKRCRDAYGVATSHLSLSEPNAPNGLTPSKIHLYPPDRYLSIAFRHDWYYTLLLAIVFCWRLTVGHLFGRMILRVVDHYIALVLPRLYAIGLAHQP